MASAAVDITPVSEYVKQGADVFDYNDTTLVDNSIQQVMLTKYNSLIPINPDSTNFYFRVDDLHSWFSLSRSFIKLSFKIVKLDAAGAPVIGSNDAVTWTEDIRCAFNRIRVMLGGQVLYDCPQFFWNQALIEKCYWTTEYMDTVGTEMGCDWSNCSQYGINQISGLVAPFHIQDAVGIAQINNCYNCGYANRGKWSNGLETNREGVVHLCVPLYHLCPALQFFDKATKGLEFSLEMWKSDNAINTVNKTSFNANPALNQSGKISWITDRFGNNGISLFMRRIVPTSTYNLLLQERLNKGIDIVTKFSSPNIYRFGVERNQTSFDQHVITTASRPLFAQVIFQLRRNTDGTNVGAGNNCMYATDEFEHAYVTSIAAYCNGLKVPQEGINQSINEVKTYTNALANVNPFPYVVKTNTQNWANAYYWYLKNSGHFRAPYLNNFQDGTGILKYQDWKNKLPIYTFDLSLNQVASWSGGSTQINIRGTRDDTSAGTPNQAPDDYYMWVFLHTEQSLGVHLESFNNYTTIT